MRRVPWPDPNLIPIEEDPEWGQFLKQYPNACRDTIIQTRATMAESRGRPHQYLGGWYEERLVDDGLEPAVFSDGRGDGCAETRWCWYCGIVIRAGSCVEEHMTPRSARGADDASNIVAACTSCNVMKGSRTVEGYRHLLSERLKTPVIFAGEADVYVEGGSGFEHILAFTVEEREQMIEESVKKKLPDPPKIDVWKNNPTRNLIGKRRE